MTDKKCNTCKQPRPATEYEPGRAICNGCRWEKKNTGRRDARLETRITRYLPYLTEWRSVRSAADRFDLTTQAMGETLRKLEHDGFVAMREVKMAWGGKPTKEYRRTEAGVAALELLIPPPRYRHPWEALGEENRPDWGQSNRHIPTPSC